MIWLQNFLLNVGLQAFVFSGSLLVFVWFGRYLFRARNRPVILAGLVLLIAMWFFALVPIPNLFESLRPSQNVEPRLASVAKSDLEPASPSKIVNEQENSPTPGRKEDVDNTSEEGVAPALSTGPLTDQESPKLKQLVDAISQLGQGTREEASVGLLSSNIDQQFRSVFEQLEKIPAKADSKVPWSSDWRGWFTLFVVTAGLFGLVRLVIALVSLSRLRSGSTMIDSNSLSEVTAIIKAKLGLKQAIELRETDQTNAALTIGWWKPVVLFSDTWRDWDARQLEATIAHELAHIANKDFLQRLIAQVTAILHFYNPLVHLLCNTLKLEQEIAADEHAAQVLGGRKEYLNTLAEMAIENDCPNGRLAPMFLPTRKTFFRRIEMLRKNEKRCLPIQSNLQRRRGWLVMGMVLLMAVSIAGLRLPESTVAQESTKTGAGTTTVFEDEIAANSRSSRVPSGEVVTDATDSDSLKIPLKIAVPADIGPKLMQGKILKAPVQARHPGTNKILDSSLVTGVSLYRQGKDPDLLKSLAVAGRPTGKGVLRFSLGDEHFDALESSVLKYEFGSRELGRYKHIEIAYENSTPQPKPTTGPALLASDTPADLRFVESRTAVAVITRPARIVNHPLVKKLAEKSQTIGGGRSSVVDELGKMLHLADCGLKPSQVDQATIVFSDPRQPSQVAVVLRTDEDAWWESDDSNATFKKQFGELEPISFRGEQVLIQKGNEDRYWYIADSKTIVWTLDIHSMRRAIVAKNGPENLKWVSSWRQHANDSVSFYAAAEPIHAMTGFLGGDPVFDLVSPILEETNFAVGGFKADGNLSATITAGFDDAQTATEMAEVVTGLKALTLLMLKRDIESFPKESQQLGRLAMQALGEMKITSKDQTALATTSVKGGEELLAMATPVLKRQNKLAISTDSMNNIRQLGLAMHNYESAFQAFPPPVLYSRHGKAYSWRIALLPFLERNDLYDQYRFDEEWNSPHNRLVTSSMPDVFRHPLSDENSTNSDYFVVTGDETIFPKIKAIAEGKASVKGTGFGQITDGSSNTILLVEAKRNTHWAKPEDIPYQSGETLKDLGGFQKESFVVALADGSTQVCSAKVGKLTLEIFLRKADGQIAYTSNLSNPQPEVEDAGKLFSRTPRRAEPASTKLNMALPIQKPSTIEKQEDYFDDPSSGKRFR